MSDKSIGGSVNAWWAACQPLEVVEGASNKKQTLGDPINHPSHYNSGRLEVIDVIEDWDLDFHLGNAVKYIARAEHKGELVQDLKKAMWYLKRRIEQGEKGEGAERRKRG